MSDATRAVALTQAVHVVGDEGLEAVLSAAKRFDDFLNLVGDEAPPQTSAAGKEPAAPAKGPGRPRKAPKTEEEAVSQSVEDDKNAADLSGEAATGLYPANKTGVQAIIAKLLAANKRKEAIALLKEFNAASATGVKDKDAAKFIAKAKTLLGGESSGEDDLTA